MLIDGVVYRTVRCVQIGFSLNIRVINVKNLVLSLFLTGRFQLYKLQVYQCIYCYKYTEVMMITNRLFSTVVLGYTITLKYTPDY